MTCAWEALQQTQTRHFFRHGGTVRCLKALLRQKLVHHDSSKYDGYRLTPLGYDFLALKALVNRGAVASVGRQIGVGKESDVYEVRAQVVCVRCSRAAPLYRFGLSRSQESQGWSWQTAGSKIAQAGGESALLGPAKAVVCTTEPI